MNSRNKQIASASMLVAIYAIITFLNTFIALELIIILFLPLYSTYIFIKANASIKVAFLVSAIITTALIDINTSLLYITPAILSGGLLSYLIKWKVSNYYLVIITAGGNFLLLLLTNYLITLLYDINIINNAQQLLNNDSNFVIVIAALIALTQAIITFYIAREELKKLNITLKNTKVTFISLLIPFLIFPLGFIPNAPISLTAAVLFIFFYLPNAISFYQNKYCNLFIILQVVSLFFCLPLLQFFPTTIMHQVYLIPLFLTLFCGFLVKIYK